MKAQTGDGSPEAGNVPLSHLPAPAPARPVIRVACGVLCRADGRVLMAQRPEGKIAAGWWEFPGGKIEADESPRAALARELHEELGVSLRAAQPLIRFAHDYSNRRVLLDTWLVTAFDGEPCSREGQAFRWLPVAELAAQDPVLPTVAPIAAALRLPGHYVFTPATAELPALLLGLPRLPAGALLRLRLRGCPAARYVEVASALLAATRPLGLKLILDDPDLVTRLGADGWHADSRRLMALGARPQGPGLCLASVHDGAQLQQALRLGFDAAVLGPVSPTASHPGHPGLAWDGFEALRGTLPLPVFAIGGLGPAQLDQARQHRAQGLAGISAYWSS